MIVNLLKYWLYAFRGKCKHKIDVRSRLYTGNRRAFIIGTGPSACMALRKVTELEKKTDVDFIVYNELIFMEYDVISVLKPTIFVLMDPLYFQPNKESFIGDKGLSYTIYRLREALNSISWSIKVIIPDMFELTMNNPNVQIVKINTFADGYTYGKKRFEYYDKNYLVPGANNVLQVALYLAVLIGYKDIGFIGGEYSFWKDCYIDETDMKAKLKISHCYGKVEGIPEAFPLDEDGDMYRGKRMGSVSAFLRRSAESLDIFYYIQEYAEWKGAKIINYSKGTMIEAFAIGQFTDYLCM